MATQYPYQFVARFSRGQELALKAILDGGIAPKDVGTVIDLVRVYVQEGIIRSGIPLGPVEVSPGEVIIAPVPPEKDSVQKMRTDREAQLGRAIGELRRELASTRDLIDKEGCLSCPLRGRWVGEQE